MTPNLNKKLHECSICLEAIHSYAQKTQEEKQVIIQITPNSPQKLQNPQSINTTLKCGHLFHGECIQRWLKQKPVCPLCITPIETSITPLSFFSSNNSSSITTSHQQNENLHTLVCLINNVSTHLMANISNSPF